jgi:hypothetical protein
MGIYPEDSYPEEKTHNHAKYTYAPYLVVPRPAKIVKCGGWNACDFTFGRSLVILAQWNWQSQQLMRKRRRALTVLGMVPVLLRVFAVF